MNKCLNCGNEIINGDKFCRKCGTKVQVENNNNNTGFNNNLNSNINYNGKEQIRKDSLSTPVIVVIGLVIVILFVVFMPTMKNESSTKQQENTNTNNNEILNNNISKNETITFNGLKLNKFEGYTYRTRSGNGRSYLEIIDNNTGEMVSIGKIFDISIEDVNKKTKEIKQNVIALGFTVGRIKYNTYKNKKFYTIEVTTDDNQKFISGYYELSRNKVIEIIMNDKDYKKYTYNSYSLIYNTFNN